MSGARVLAEIGDDRTRFTDARALKAYAGSAPITRAVGTSYVHHRKARNRRLTTVGHVWPFASLKGPGPRAHDDHRRKVGDRHSSALRSTFNRTLDCLSPRLQTRQRFDAATAFKALLESST